MLDSQFEMSVDAQPEGGGLIDGLFGSAGGRDLIGPSVQPPGLLSSIVYIFPPHFQKKTSPNPSVLWNLGQANELIRCDPLNQREKTP